MKIALVGLGDIGTIAHLPALINDPRVDLCAVVESNSRRLSTAAEGLPASVLRATELSDAMVDATPDGVVLATPPWVTTGLAEVALRAGRYVLAEKPIAVSIDAASALRQLDDRHLERLQIGFTYRHDPAMERLQELVRDDVFGSPLLIRFAFFDEPADPVGNPEHFARLVRTLEEAPPIVHEGAHICDWLNLLLDETPQAIQGWQLRSDPALPAGNVNGFVVRYRGDTTVLIEVAWLYPEGRYPQSHITLTGPRAHAELDPGSFALRLTTAEKTELVCGRSDRYTRCFRIQLERFVSAYEAQEPCMPGINEALASLEYTDLLAANLGSPRALA